MPVELPLADEGWVPRADAQRNRDALLAAALALVAAHGVDAVTMDQVAAAAGVGKGTVFRRFGSRAGLMAAVLNQSELEWQSNVISGQPPLGPGAAPYQRLLAFGESRSRLNARHVDLIRASDGVDGGGRSLAFAVMHVRYLLGELGVTGDTQYLAAALIAPLDLPAVRGLVPDDLEAAIAGWQDLARRVVGRQGSVS